MGSASTKFRKYLQNGDEYAAMQVFQGSPELQKSLNPNLSYGDSYMHNTPLHLAARHAMKHLLRTFLNDLGGNPNKKNGRNETCLHSVCQMSHTKSLSAHDRRHACVVFILQWRGAAVLADGQMEKIDLTACDDNKNTALHCAAASGLASCVELLVAHGSAVFAENADKETPCDCAVKAGHVKIAQFLESKMVFMDMADTVNEADLVHSLDTHEMYSGLRAQDLQETKDQLLVETSDMLHVPLFTSEALLRDNEWSRETLLENWMKDPVSCCERAGVHPPKTAFQTAYLDVCSTPLSETEIASEVATTTSSEYHEEIPQGSPVRVAVADAALDELVCEICTGNIPIDEETVPMVCGHQFCHCCWESYLNVKIQEGDAHNILCPAFGCLWLVPVDVIEGLVAPDMVRRYLQFDIKAFVESNPNIKWCPFPGCGRAVRLPENEVAHSPIVHVPNAPPPMLTSHAVDCGNGHFFCWECLEEAHAPCCCSKWVEWHKKIAEVRPEELKSTCVATEDAANCLWLVTNSKPCPNCKSPIQKNEGCNHMKCSKCKFDFCWICLDGWKKHSSGTGGYFRCNRFDAVHRAEERHGVLVSAAEVRNKDLQELNRFVYYYTRFKKHDNNHKLEEPLLKTCRYKMALLAHSMHEFAGPPSDGEVETKFVEYAIIELLKARRVLCGSYVYGYYLEDNGYNRTIFQFMQAELEESTERLALMVARPYLRSPRSKIIQSSTLVKRKRQEFTMAVSKGLIPPETPPTVRRNRRRRFPCLMGMDPVEDHEQLSQAIAASLNDLDPDNPWVKDNRGLHANLAAIYDWPDYNSDDDEEEAEAERAALAASILGLCSRKGCTKPRARNPRRGSLHDYCSLRCSKLDKFGDAEDTSLPYTSDYQMDLLIALEMSRLQMIEDMERMAVKSDHVPSDLPERRDDQCVPETASKPGNEDVFHVLQEPPMDEGDEPQDDADERGDLTLPRTESESPLNVLENLGDQGGFIHALNVMLELAAVSAKVIGSPEKRSNAGICLNIRICSSPIDVEPNVIGNGSASAVAEPGSIVCGATDEVTRSGLSAADPPLPPPSPRTNTDLAVEYFLKSLGDKDNYAKNMNSSCADDAHYMKAEKEMITFCGKNATKCADNAVTTITAAAATTEGATLGSFIAGAAAATTKRPSPRCSCMMHDADAESTSRDLWEVQGASTSGSAYNLQSTSGDTSVPTCRTEGNSPSYGRLKKSPTDGSLCFEAANRGGASAVGRPGAKRAGIGGMSWDLSVSLDTLSKKSSGVLKSLKKVDVRKQGHQQQQSRPHSNVESDRAHLRENAPLEGSSSAPPTIPHRHRGRWFDWELF